MEPETLSVRTPAELRLLLDAKPRVRFEVDLPHLSRDENFELEKRLRASINACGCVEATFGLLFGLAVDIIDWLAFQRIPTIAMIALPLALMAAGKMLGRRRGRTRLREIVADASLAR